MKKYDVCVKPAIAHWLKGGDDFIVLPVPAFTYAIVSLKDESKAFSVGIGFKWGFWGIAIALYAVPHDSEDK